jgi:hypothetical protein
LEPSAQKLSVARVSIVKVCVAGSSRFLSRSVQFFVSVFRSVGMLGRVFADVEGVLGISGFMSHHSNSQAEMVKMCYKRITGSS